MATGDDDDRVAQGIDHLQTAAHELIAAARSFLDVLEDVVSDRDKLGDMATAVGSAVESAVRSTRERDGVEHVRVD